MTLPQVTAPPDVPLFVVRGHRHQDDVAFADVQVGVGFARRRRRWTVTERIVAVEWVLDPSEVQEVERWYEFGLDVGTRWWSAQLRNLDGPGLRWYEVRWIAFSFEALAKGRSRVLGQLLVLGEGEGTGPDTSRLTSAFAGALVDVRSGLFIDRPLTLIVGAALIEPAQLVLGVGAELVEEYGS